MYKNNKMCLDIYIIFQALISMHLQLNDHEPLRVNKIWLHCRKIAEQILLLYSFEKIL